MVFIAFDVSVEGCNSNVLPAKLPPEMERMACTFYDFRPGTVKAVVILFFDSAKKVLDETGALNLSLNFTLLAPFDHEGEIIDLTTRRTARLPLFNDCQMEDCETADGPDEISTMIVEPIIHQKLMLKGKDGHTIEVTF